MIKEFLAKYSNRLICLLVFWQFFSVLMISVFNWPKEVIWLNLVVFSVFILLAEVYESLLFLILLLPFYVVLPNSYFDSLSIWRPLFVLLFIVWVVRDLRFKILDLRFFAWDKYLGYFFIIAFLVSILFARFRIQSLKQLLFLLNVYLFYLVAVNVLKSREQIVGAVKYLLYTLTIIITLGFIQLFATFFTSLDTFWVYWADNISSIYYGNYFSSVALYSNSWFAYTGLRDLRMFSIMPDSQSFAYICLWGLGIGTAYTLAVSESFRKWLWSGIRSAGLALMISGTRAVWVGMLAPFFLVLLAKVKKFMPFAAKKFLWPFVIVLILFTVSPLFNRALQYARLGGKFQENFLLRAKSIYDLRETSNLGRLLIWKESGIFLLKHPWGVGLSNFLVSLNPNLRNQNYEQIANGVVERYNLPARYVSAHNLFLQILVETGVFGFLMFVVFFWIVFKKIWQFLLAHKNDFNFFTLFVFQAGLSFSWILGASFFDVTLLNDKILTIFFLILAITGIILKNYEQLNNHV